MPKLKQPVSLRNAAMDVLLVFCANHCDKYSKEDSLDKIRQGIAFIKEDMCLQMPRYLEEEFCHQLMKKFMMSTGYIIKRPKNHIRAVAEVMMDRRIIGLRCYNRVTASFNPDDAHRILGLKELNLGSRVPGILKNYHLEDITLLAYQEHCTDSDLELIGRNCQKLLHLDVCRSHRVTNVGLRAVSSCSDLHTVLIERSSVTQSGIIEFLSVNKKIRKIFAVCDDNGFTCESYLLLGSSVYPSIESFTINLDHSAVGNLKSIAVTFPNLKSLRILGGYVGDLVLPNSFSRISELYIFWLHSSDYRQVHDLVRFVGENLKKLEFRSVIRCGDWAVRQIDLDFIFKSCANLEELEFDYKFDEYAEKLFIPKFGELKVLQINYLVRSRGKVEFGQMCELERLMLSGYCTTFNELKSIILDHTKFPKLKEITLTDPPNSTDMSRLRHIAKVGNLDVEFIELCLPRR